MGHNYISNIGKDIAMKLGLSNPECYTGHCFRRTSATLACDAGADAEQLKRLGKWSSSKVVGRYIANSVAGAEAISQKLAPSTSSVKNSVVVSEGGEGSGTFHIMGNYINLSHGSNNTLNFN